jgi:hypothetical protein
MFNFALDSFLLLLLLSYCYFYLLFCCQSTFNGEKKTQRTFAFIECFVFKEFCFLFNRERESSIFKTCVLLQNNEEKITEFRAKHREWNGEILPFILPIQVTSCRVCR